MTRVLVLFVAAFALQPGPPAIVPDLGELASPQARGRVVGRAVSAFHDDRHRGVRISERGGPGLVWIPGVRFATGTIELEVRGKDVFQQSFVGIAFHGGSDTRYSVVYLRPFNFRADDPVRRSHAIQYAAHPEYPWAKLRAQRPGEFEKGLAGTIDPNNWVRLRVEVSVDRVRAFVAGSNMPALDVPRLGSIGEGLVGLWVGEGSGGDFANLRIETSQGVARGQFPVRPQLFIEQFGAAEGITFNAEGRLFIGADNAIWLAEPDGAVRRITDVHRHLGQAGFGSRDILAADFGPLNVFEHGANDDGVIWRVTPEGKKTVVATGIADPNAIVVLKDRSLLVSDDGTDKIYHVRDGKVSVWSTDVPYPNGMALSRDDTVLYVAQIFNSLKPIIGDDRVWAFSLANGTRVTAPTVAARTGEGGLDGLVADERDRIYIADNGAGKIWRFDPASGETTLIAEGMPGVASLVFGEGRFDREAIYATSTRRGGGRIWKVPVSVRGAPLHR